jgi:hypothetical protein
MNPSGGFDNGSRATFRQIYPSDQGEITDQVDAISPWSQSRDISERLDLNRSLRVLISLQSRSGSTCCRTPTWFYSQTSPWVRPML